MTTISNNFGPPPYVDYDTNVYGQNGNSPAPAPGPSPSAPVTHNPVIYQVVNPLLIMINTMMHFVNLNATWILTVSQQMDQQNKLAEGAKEQAANLDGIITNMTDANAKQDVPPDVLQFCRDNNIVIQTDKGPMNIDDYLKSIGHPDGKGLDKEQMTRIQSALSATADQASNLSAQYQLKMQQYMSNYNNGISQISSFIKAISDAVSGVIRNF
ncbi:MAG: hypothetical protein JO171_02820 [Paludibacterium sp.]|uniref:hypothetical protein n=1 Tax=Paludibacterium sp. TaxID=1917523 RepID=UPI0025F7EE62|nr:hypothetical protein [Paludibacterium sp.]MBV8046058.1 hypothetical protein [Paludibacterium sp.]MBV8646147.1 hypothetical protein [Paludibacterium sp.]